MTALILPVSGVRPPSVSIGPASYEALSGPAIWRVVSTSTAVSAVWPAASTSILYPFSVSKSCTAVKMWMSNGATVSGNVDIGIYDGVGTLLRSMGSTAQAGTSTIQQFDITDLGLVPGTSYLMALVMDNITGTVIRNVAGTAASQLAALGVCQVAANFPLATGVTFALLTNNYLPHFGLSRLATF